MFFASRRMTLLAATVVATVLSGCGATDKRPGIYDNIIEVKTRLPAHASRLASHTSLQQALIKRNLVIAESGDILPVNGGSCGTPLYYRFTSPSLPLYMSSHAELYAGYYADVDKIDQQWQIVDTDLSFSHTRPTGVSVSLFAMSLSGKLAPNDTVFVRPSPQTSPDDQRDLISQVKRLLPGVKVKGISRNSNTQINASVASSKARLRELIDTKQSAVGTVVDEQVLLACSELRDFINPVSVRTVQSRYTPEEAIEALPSDADFTALDKQQMLLPSDKYMTVDGDIVEYTAYFQKRQQDPCASGNSQNAALCRKRVNDGEQRQVKNKVTITIPTSQR